MLIVLLDGFWVKFLELWVHERKMEWGTLPSQVPFFPFFCIFSLWVSSFSLNFLVCSSLFTFKFDLPT
jgi:hypothetical protein